MSLIGDLLKGMIIFSILSLTQSGCSVKEMSQKAVKSHEKGLTSYGAYSRMLTGSQTSWATYKK